MTQTAILEGLSKSKLAVEMTEDQRKALAAVMTLRDLTQGEVVVREEQKKVAERKPPKIESPAPKVEKSELIGVPSALAMA